MPKNPSSRWFWNDHLNDQGLKRCTYAEKGFWIDLLGHLANEESPGVFTGTREELARMMGCPLADFKRLLDGLARRKVCDFQENPDGTITLRSRRMVRDERERVQHCSRQTDYEKKRQGGGQRGAPDGHPDVPPDGGPDGHSDGGLTEKMTATCPSPLLASLPQAKKALSGEGLKPITKGRFRAVLDELHHLRPEPPPEFWRQFGDIPEPLLIAELRKLNDRIGEGPGPPPRSRKDVEDRVAKWLQRHREHLMACDEGRKYLAALTAGLFRDAGHETEGLKRRESCSPAMGVAYDARDGGSATAGDKVAATIVHPPPGSGVTQGE